MARKKKYLKGKKLPPHVISQQHKHSGPVDHQPAPDDSYPKHFALDGFGIYINFSGPWQNQWRLLFTILFVILNVSLYKVLDNNISLVKFSKSQRYDTVITDAKCINYPKPTPTQDKEMTRGVLELIIENYTFAALNLPYAKCAEIFHFVNEQPDLLLFHHELLIYQIQHKNRILLSFEEQRSHLEKTRELLNKSQLFSLIFLWMISYRGLVNLAKPGLIKYGDLAKYKQREKKSGKKNPNNL